MKKLKLNYAFSTIAGMVIAMFIFSSCTNDGADNITVESVEENASSVFEKQFVVKDKSGNNSITLKLSSDDEALFAEQDIDNFELIINPVISGGGSLETPEKGRQASEPIEFLDGVEDVQVAIRLSVVKIDFKDEVSSYSLVTGPGLASGDNVSARSINLCLWQPRTSSFFQIDNIWATGMTTTFGRTKKTCNNIEFRHYAYDLTITGANTPFKSYQLKHPGDQETTNSVGVGMTVLYRWKKNSAATIVWNF